MALTKQQKEQTIQEVAQHVSEAKAAVFVAFDGISLADIMALRDKLHESGCKMQVVPKRLLKLAMQNAKVAFDPMEAEGQVALAWGGDAVAPAKVLHEFVKGQAENMRMLSGVLEGDTLSLEQVTSLAQLPNREQLLAQLVGVMAGPIRGFAGVLAGVPRASVYVLQAIKDKKNDQAPISNGQSSSKSQ